MKPAGVFLPEWLEDFDFLALDFLALDFPAFDFLALDRCAAIDLLPRGEILHTWL
jgi:hypothetical protein